MQRSAHGEGSSAVAGSDRTIEAFGFGEAIFARQANFIFQLSNMEPSHNVDEGEVRIPG